MRQAVHDLISTGAGQDNAKIGKPSAWNQGGYDVVRIEMDAAANLHLRFGQVTKSVAHSLKLQYFFEFIKFLTGAGYEVASIEIGFIVPIGDLENFRVAHSQVAGSGLLNTIPLYPATEGTAWLQSKEHVQITVYGLPDIDRLPEYNCSLHLL